MSRIFLNFFNLFRLLETGDDASCGGHSRILEAYGTGPAGKNDPKTGVRKTKKPSVIFGH